MATHELKTVEPFYSAVKRGEKPFEVRRDDRGFDVGDILVLQKWDQHRGIYVTTGEFARPYEETTARVTYILRGGDFGIERGFVVMGIELIGGP